MDFYRTTDNYILRKGGNSLWCNRANGSLKLRNEKAIDDLPMEVKCSGLVYGIVGKIQFLPGNSSKLVVITKQSDVGQLTDGSIIYRIDKIILVPLSSEECLEISELQICEEHKDDFATLRQNVRDVQPRVTQTFNNLKTSFTNQFKNSGKTPSQKAMEKDVRDKEKLDKLDKRLQEEFLKMFNDTESFYYSEKGDLTNTLQRIQKKKPENQDLPAWKTADENFFWNKSMLKEIISLEETDSEANNWIIPVIQGYVEHANCVVDFSDVEHHEIMKIGPENFDLLLISRRAVTRAGTRYKRRGIDEEGNVANYVETEQIVRAGHHNLSFVQIRGSIPLYWSQAGIKYRPPSKLERTKEESHEAMKLHFNKELSSYKGVIVINLVDQSGREQILADAFMEQIITLNSAQLTYVTFDFHEYCRGMRFENVSVLVESLPEIIEDMRYCWVDRHGIICEQRCVFRVNCMDCLDRTNVVQASLARAVLKSQLRKLGRLMPEQSLPNDVRDIYQHMWADNGDAISRQYAGTAAMKGDFTRTGERRFTGVMKDGYHSANRYLNRFTAAYRQTVIDIMLGIAPSEDITLLIAAMKQSEDPEEEWTLEREEWVAQLVDHCQELLVNQDEIYLCGWALIEPRISSEGEIDPDFEQEVVLLLTDKSFYISRYEEEDEYVNQYERESLSDLEKIEIGPSASLKTRNCYLRLLYRSEGESGYFRTFKAVYNSTSIEEQAVLHGIAEEFHKACDATKIALRINECKLNRKKSKPHNIISMSAKSRPFRTDTSRKQVPAVSGEVYNLNLNSEHNLDNIANIPETNRAPRSTASEDDLPRDSRGNQNQTLAVGNSREDVQKSENSELNLNDTPRDVPRVDTTRGESGGKGTIRDNSSDKNVVESTRDNATRENATRENATRENATREKTSLLVEKEVYLSTNTQKLDEKREASEEKPKELTTSIANFKKNVRSKFIDVSVKFQRNKESSDNSTEIVWSQNEDVETTSEQPRSKRNILMAAQERGRDLKNKLSVLSNRSPKTERKKNWTQIIKDSNCKTRIIQL